MTAFAASEARWLAEPDRDFCDVLGCTNEAESDSILCARHEDDDHEYRNGDAQP